jgi:hypothetical protein
VITAPRRHAIFALLCLSLFGFAATAVPQVEDTGAQRGVGDTHLTVHEWGTFTSLFDKDGTMLRWRPLAGPQDLPGFVYNRLRNAKTRIHGTVRMETPVLYFYTDRETTISLEVRFPQGKITEWYPYAHISGGEEILWERFTVLPGAETTLAREEEESHYYPARETDAAPLRTQDDAGTQQYEKFLFYRGVGSFTLPLSVRVEGNSVVVQGNAPNSIGQIILLECRNGRLGYRLHTLQVGPNRVERPVVGDQTPEGLRSEMAALLVGHGLYEREAQAMMNTWGSLWVEDGLRVFYLLPQPMTERLLPITMNPTPVSLVRVLVARAEILTPEDEQAVAEVVARLADPSVERSEITRQLERYGRFAEPLVLRILGTTQDRAIGDGILEMFPGIEQEF